MRFRPCFTIDTQEQCRALKARNEGAARQGNWPATLFFFSNVPNLVRARLSPSASRRPLLSISLFYLQALCPSAIVRRGSPPGNPLKLRPYAHWHSSSNHTQSPKSPYVQATCRAAYICRATERDRCALHPYFAQRLFLISTSRLVYE